MNEKQKAKDELRKTLLAHKTKVNEEISSNNYKMQLMTDKQKILKRQRGEIHKLIKVLMSD